MSERNTEGKDHKEEDDEDDIEEPDLKVRESWEMGNGLKLSCVFSSLYPSVASPLLCCMATPPGIQRGCPTPCTRIPVTVVESAHIVVAKDTCVRPALHQKNTRVSPVN